MVGKTVARKKPKSASKAKKTAAKKSRGTKAAAKPSAFKSVKPKKKVAKKANIKAIAKKAIAKKPVQKKPVAKTPAPKKVPTRISAKSIAPHVALTVAAKQRGKSQKIGDAALEKSARAWLERDPDPVTAVALEQMLDAGDEAGLRRAFCGPLEFGTAGLRGVIGPGESQMNLGVVVTATAALCDVLRTKVPDAQFRGIVIGYDARHRSRDFAEAAADIAAAAGFRVWLFTEPVPTPLVAYTVRDRETAAGIVITASHNPPEYNGYKVYWANGAQIIPPVDGWIRDGIPEKQKIGAKSLLTHSRTHMQNAPLAAPLRWLQQYVAHLSDVRVLPKLELSSLKIAYTPMHGVGGTFVQAMMERENIAAFYPVPSQMKPDPDFPTVRFPNPEEPGAMDALLAVAAQHDCDVAFANDPDADRLAVAVRDGGGYRALTGNEIGVLMAAHLLSHVEASDYSVATTVVSSRQLQALAKREGADYLETLTGFKWIANAARRHELETRKKFLFGYEEALGYTAFGLVRDKDGIGAALVFTELVASLKAQDKTVRDLAFEIAQKIGAFASVQKSINATGTDGLAKLRERLAVLRANPPATVGNLKIDKVVDYLAGHNQLPPTDMLEWSVPGARILLRPSGTEPKLKVYVETFRALPTGADRKVWNTLEATLAAQAQELSEAAAKLLG